MSELTSKQVSKKLIDERLEKMESLLSHSALGVHILFDNRSIADVFRDLKDDSNLSNFEKMKKVQDVMTQLVAKGSYLEKVNFLQSLDKDSYQMLIQAYFHIVENTVRANNDYKH